MKSKAKKVAIYARVSTANGQTPENQSRALREVAARHGWQVTAEYVDHGISGAKGRDQRPEFDNLCRAIARKEFDLVMAWSVDRLGRSLQDLVSFLSELHAKDVDLYLDRQGIDTTTPAGKAMFQMMGVFAEFERAIIRERIMAGLTRAKEGGTRSGRPIGRPRTVTPEMEKAIQIARTQGHSLRKIAKETGTSLRSVQRVLGSKAA